MGFISSLIGGQNGFNAASPTENSQVQTQSMLPQRTDTGQFIFEDQNKRANNIVGQQGDLAQQLLAQSQGQGPNIAAMQLQQATDRNNAQAAGALASQRGLNPELAQRLIAQNQASNNQQAAGQSGLMRAQQQLASQGQLANVYGQQANETLQGESLANQNLGINQNALNAQNGLISNNRNNANQINSQNAQANANANTQMFGTVTNAAGAAFGLAHGGKVQTNEERLEKVFKGESYKQGGHVPGKAMKDGDHPENDTVPAMLSPGEVVLPRSVTQSEDPEGRAVEFLKALKAHKEPGPKGFSKILEAKRKMKEAMGHMEDAHKMMKKVMGGEIY